MTACCALAIEASTEQLSLAACNAGQTASWRVRPARDETAQLYQHAARLLAEVGADFGRLDFLAFGCGPGSFTGVRIAAAAVQAIGFAGDVPVCRVSSLAVLAAGACRLHGAGCVAVAFDARMESAYVGLYRVGPDGLPEALVADSLVKPDRFTLPGQGDVIAAGDAWTAYPALLARHRPRVRILDADLRPSADDLLQIGQGEFRAGRVVAALEALPEYLSPGPAASLAATGGKERESA